MSININSNFNDDKLIWEVDLSGELDVSTADKLKEHLTQLTEKNLVDIKIEATDLEYIDSTGLGAMIGILKRLKEKEKDIYILNPRNNVRKLFNITGLDKIFKLEG